MPTATQLEAILRRDRGVVVAGLIGISALAWSYMLFLARGMAAMEMPMPQTHAWGAVELVLLFVMWAIMMVAMMVPSAAPMILTLATLERKSRRERRPFVATGAFLLGYLLAWSGYSVLATLGQWGLHQTAFLSPMMVSTSPMLGGTLLLMAGLFQWTPLKRACLVHCRSPLGFLMTEWREGPGGAVIMGLRHGSYCVGCCWVLMALLFVAGVMNLLWVATIAAFVLVEKVVARGEAVSRVGGGVLVLAGIVLLSQGWR